MKEKAIAAFVKPLYASKDSMHNFKHILRIKKRVSLYKTDYTLIMTDQTNAFSVFQGKDIRKTWHNNEWWFVLEDVVFALTDSYDPKQYLNKMKQRDEPLAQGWVQLVHTLSIDTPLSIK